MRFYLSAFLFLLCSFAFANDVTLEKVSGNVSVAAAKASAVAAVAGQKIQQGSTVVTGEDGAVVMRFSDGQVVSLLGNTTMRISTYRYEEKSPSADSTALELVKGALRSLSGLLAKRNPNAFKLSTPNATIGIRGTDFMVVHQNPSFVNVINGGVSVSSSGGTIALGAGQVAGVASAVAAPATLSMAALPATAQGAFSTLASQSLSAAAAAGTSGTTGSGAGSAAGGSTGGAAGGSAASGAAAGGATSGVAGGAAAGSAVAAGGAAVGGITVGGIAAGVAAAAAVGVAAGGGDGGGGSTTSTATQTK